MFDDIEQTATFIRDAIRDIPKQFDYNGKAQSKLDKERQDIMHYMEFCNLNASDGCKAYKDFQRVSKERRKHKNENELLAEINNIFIKLKPHINELDQAIGSLRKVKTNQNNRTYKCKVRNDLQDKFEGAGK
ncbi:hypothetical protein QGM71_01100 [Virgibacillus sp. C22-A2]|uniref:Uncharacterized protein n=1 Tax=Virgibacillus tibetensis TaxID=3042313 RepID=A0ABU6KC96_9BACI|nr:hypothetical protein [Virgibacillus sp. C22-A2]